MTDVEEIRAEQRWHDDYIAKTLKGIAESLVVKSNKKTAHTRAALSLIRRSEVNQYYYGCMKRV